MFVYFLLLLLFWFKSLQFVVSGSGVSVTHLRLGCGHGNWEVVGEYVGLTITKITLTDSEGSWRVLEYKWG